MKNLCTKLSILLLLSSAPLVISMDKKSPPPPPTLKEDKKETDFEVTRKLEKAIYANVAEVEKNTAIANAQYNPVNSSAAIIAEAHRKLDNPKKKKHHHSKRSKEEREILRFSKHCDKITNYFGKAENFLKAYCSSQDQTDMDKETTLKLIHLQEHVNKVYAIYAQSKRQDTLKDSPAGLKLLSQWNILDTLAKQTSELVKNKSIAVNRFGYYNNVTFALNSFAPFMEKLKK